MRLTSILLYVVLISCKPSMEVPPVVNEPKPSVPWEPMPLYTAKETDVPFLTGWSKEEEAFLVLAGVDNDHQVNGKISLADVRQVEFLPLKYAETSSYFMHEKWAWLKGQDSTVKTYSFPRALRRFPHLREVRITYSTLVDVSGLPNLRKILISTGPIMPVQVYPKGNGDMDFSESPLLEEVSYYGEGKVFNFTGNPNLKRLFIDTKELEELDLSRNPGLEYVKVDRAPKLKRILISKASFAKIRDGALGYVQQNWVKGEGATWEVAEH